MIDRSHYRQVVTSSLEVGPGDLFVALIGARDGHEFVSDAIARGATGVVVSRDVPVPDGVDVYRVSDTLVALRELARSHRAAFSADVFAITGSVGKTTTKDLLVHVLTALGRSALGSPKSFNNHLGVPLTLLMAGDHDDVIAEVGTNHPGEIADLATLVMPRAAMVTGVGYAHVGSFASREALADEKASIFAAVDPSGVWFVNADDPLLGDAVGRLAKPPATQVITYGTSPDADVRATEVRVDDDGTHGVVTVGSGGGAARVAFHLPLLGRHFAVTAAAILAVIAERGLNVAQAASALGSFPGSVGRAAIAQHGSVRVIDDSYNGSPDSMLAGLETLADLPEPRRIAVLGEMRELGAWSHAMHQAVGTAVGSAATDLVFVGPSYDIVRDAAIAAGSPGSHIHSAESATQAALLLRDILTPDEPTAVLVKGARFIHTERVALALEGVQVTCGLALCDLYIHCRTCPELAR